MDGWKVVKIIFGIRAFLWAIAAGATVYWIYWSFKIYNMGYQVPEEYSPRFRPIFYKSLGVTLAVLLICLVLRKISDTIKTELKKSERGFEEKKEKGF